MVFTNWGAQSAVYGLGSYSSGIYLIQSVEVGYGSGTVAVGNTTLVAGSIRNMQTGSPNFFAARKLRFQADFSSQAVSGLQLREFGLFASGTLGIGSAFAREGFNPITFDGTNELLITYNLEAIPG